MTIQTDRETMLDWLKQRQQYKKTEREKKMKKYEEEEQPEETQQEEEDQSSLFDEATELKKEMVSRFYDKKLLLEEPISVEVKGLGTNKFGKKVLIFDYEDEERSLNISNSNYNELIDLFGKKLSDWKGRKLKISAREFVSNDERYANGVTLIFKAL